jgi:hypothetical protein
MVLLDWAAKLKTVTTMFLLKKTGNKDDDNDDSNHTKIIIATIITIRVERGGGRGEVGFILVPMARLGLDNDGVSEIFPFENGFVC